MSVHVIYIACLRLDVKDLGDIEYTFVRDVEVEQKPVPTFTYGRRVRIAVCWLTTAPLVMYLLGIRTWSSFGLPR